VLPDGASFLRYDPGALASVCTREAYDELWALSRDVPPTPNPLNRHTHIKRKQGTFGAAYKFGAQKSERLDGPQGVLGGRFENEDAWPFLVRACVDDARRRVGDGVFGDAFGPHNAAAHVNWYPDGTAGMGRHSDAEPSLVRGAPIFSYSFLSGGATSPARTFDLFEKTGAPACASQRPFAAVPLAHGDACVMAGAFQDAYEHGVRATAAKAHRGHSRINVTVRALARRDDEERETAR
jgi:alkylated DNA repair dioxygenase AlkB